MSCVAGERRVAATRTPFASRTGPGSLLTARPLIARYSQKWTSSVAARADSRPLAPHSLRERDLARCSRRAGSSHAIRKSGRLVSHAIRKSGRLVSPAAPIRGHSHPIRFANGTWLAAHGAPAHRTLFAKVDV